jgi:hypothetical protein
MLKQCLVLLQPPFFVMRPILVAYTQKAGMAPQPRKSPLRGWGRVRFPTPGTPKSALYRIWFNAYLTT